jgi:flagellar biosynthesis protein FlhF
LTAAVQDKKFQSKSSDEKIAAAKKKIDFTIGDKTMDDIIQKNTTHEMTLNDDTYTAQIVKPKRAVQEENGTREKELFMDLINAKNGVEKTAVSIEKPLGAASSIDRFEREFSEIKEVLNKIVNDKSKGDSHTVDYGKDDSGILKTYSDILKNNDFDADDCGDILSRVKNSISRDELRDKFKIEKTLKELLKSRIVTSGPIKKGSKKKIIMFVGPTGVGKTTTIAKLGAIHALREEQKVVFVTIDNYRIAATEQLKKYAEIMRIPIYSVNNQKEFKEIITQEKADIILVDTSGRSHRNDLKISEIKSFADGVDFEIEKVLCVSANTKKSDLVSVFKAFDTMNFDSVIITKVDETSFIGNVIDIADKYSKPISYFTNGQEVPNDIVVADSDKLVDMLLGGVNN